MFGRKSASAVGLILLVSACAQFAKGDAPYTANILYQTQTGFGAGFQDVVAAGGQVAGQFSNQAAVITSSGTLIPLVTVNTTYYTSSASATDGQFQVGAGSFNNSHNHALLWHGSEASLVDLHPSGMTTSAAFAVVGGYQVGYAYDSSGVGHAMLWNGSAASAVDLSPSTFGNSYAYGVGGGQQVGYANGGTIQNGAHALLWTGTAASVIDLNPAGLFNSQAFGVGDGQQVGQAFHNGNHAYLWSGSAASAVDLNPSDFISSAAYGAGHGLQMGSGVSSTNFHNTDALVWSGTADSVVDLGVLLPANFGESYAYSCDASGDIFGIAYDTNTGYSAAIEWTPASVPEPAFLAVLGVATITLMRRRG